MDRNVESRRTLWQWAFILSFAFFTILPLTRSHLHAAEDTDPPTSNISLQGNLVGNFFTPPVTVIITATDNPSGLFQGIAYTAYRINSGTWTSYEEPFEVQNEGSYTISYFSEDRAGNPESVKTIQFDISLNPPTATPTFRPEPTASTPTSGPSATPMPTQVASPSVIPTTSTTSTGQAYPASYPYYRSPTKTPTPTSAKGKVFTAIKPTASFAPSATRVPFSPTPSQLTTESESIDNGESAAVLGKWTHVSNEQPESPAPWIMLALAVVTAGGYVFFVYFLYAKTSA